MTSFRLLILGIVLAGLLTAPFVYAVGWGSLETISVGGRKDIAEITSYGGGLVRFINVVIRYVLAVAVGLGLIVIVVGGYIYMTAGGNAQRVSTAKSVIGMALLGIVLAVAASLLLNTISPQFSGQVQEPVLKFPKSE